MDEQGSLNRAINEEIELSEYDPLWPMRFEEERDRLLSLFPDEFMAIEHFGSTAVPGLSGKPIIDILAGVESISRADALIDPMCRSKYITSAEFNATLKDRRWLMRWANGRRTHHLHIVVYRGPEWWARLAFRDALRSDPHLAARYEQRKKQLAKEFSDDREAYTEAKTEFVREVIGRAT
ncbi:MAG: GrpB family protein [Aquisalimonadaceae bacterium]